MIVMKFGGNSLSNADKVLNCVEIVKQQLSRKPIVVVSAHGKMTDCLIDCAYKALKGSFNLAEFKDFHYELIDKLKLEHQIIEPLLFRLEAFLHGVSLLRELTLRSLDHIMSFGERASSRIFAAALCNSGVSARAVNSYDIGFITDSNFSRATPLPGIEKEIAQKLKQFFLVPVITGFIGKNKNGDITTIGRSGSDFTATIIGAALEVEEIQIWTDVDGVMTADPSVDSTAQNLPQLSFDEASELAYYGAEVLHPSTLIPAIKKNIPVRVVNSNKPHEPGTVIFPRSVITKKLAKSIVYKEDICLINIISRRLLSISELLATSLDILHKGGIRAHMVVTSEASISIISDKHYTPQKLETIIEELKKFAEVNVEYEKAIICVVGEELKGKSDALGRIFSVLEKEKINARMVSQSASEINIAFIVDNSQIEKTVRALHKLIVE